MVLCVAGNTTVGQVLSVADRVLKPAKEQTVTSYFDDEPYEVAQSYIEQKFPVTIPLFTLGFKENVGDKPATTRQLAYMDILLCMLASPSSKLYNKLRDEGLINDTFGYEHMEGPRYSAILFSGESRDPKRTAEIIKDYIRDFKKNGIDKEEFERAKRAVYGETVSGFNSIEAIANIMADMHFNSREIFGLVDCIAAANADDAAVRLNELFDPDNCTLSVVCAQEE